MAYCCNRHNGESFWVLVGRYFLSRRCANLIREHAVPMNRNERSQAFCNTLDTGCNLLHAAGQISIFLLSLYGLTTSIAEVGLWPGSTNHWPPDDVECLCDPTIFRQNRTKGRLCFQCSFSDSDVVCILPGHHDQCVLGSGMVAICSWQKLRGLEKELPLAILGPLLTLLGGLCIQWLSPETSRVGNSGILLLVLLVSLCLLVYLVYRQPLMH